MIPISPAGPIYLMIIDFPLTGWNLTQTLQGYVFFARHRPRDEPLPDAAVLPDNPKDYEEAASRRGRVSRPWRIMLPLAATAVAAVAILEFQGIWNEFFWANLLLTRKPNCTVQMGLVQFRFQYQTLWPQLTAATTIANNPVLVVYVFFQRYFVAGGRLRV